MDHFFESVDQDGLLERSSLVLVSFQSKAAVELHECLYYADKKVWEQNTHKFVIKNVIQKFCLKIQHLVGGTDETRVSIGQSRSE